MSTLILPRYARIDTRALARRVCADLGIPANHETDVSRGEIRVDCANVQPAQVEDAVETYTLGAGVTYRIEGAVGRMSTTPPVNDQGLNL